MEHSQAFKDAMVLVGKDPLPEHAADQLEELERRIRPDERIMFGDLWEALIAAGGVSSSSQ